MTSKGFYSQVKARFKERIKELDKTSKDYCFNIYLNSGSNKSDSKSEYDPIEYYKFISAQYNERDEQEKETTKITIKDDFSAKINGEKIITTRETRGLHWRFKRLVPACA